MFKRVALSGSLALALLAGAVGGRAEAKQIKQQLWMPVNFKLEVSGNAGQNLTFWVAYGPVAGRFAVVQLHRVGGDWYVARKELPSRATTEFDYLAGHGTLHTRAGLEPGNPVTVIKRIGPVNVASFHPPAVQWALPVG